MSKEKSTWKKSNFACIARIILGPCTDTLRDVLKNQVSLDELKYKFWKFINAIAIDEEPFVLPVRNVIEHVQSSENYTDFDIPLLYFFLRWVCDVSLHGYKWGQYPSDKDRSLSANIERVYFIREKYKTLSKGSLKDSTFENEWENILNIVKELEKNIGSGTIYQDSMKKIRNSSMDTDVENIFIEKLLEPSSIRRFGCSVCGSRLESPFMMRNEIVVGDVERVLFLLERKFVPPEKNENLLEHITSEDLKKLFSTFKVEFQADVPGNESIAREILEDDIRKLETAFSSLSKEIMLTKLKNTNISEIMMLDPDTPKVDACVFEVDVVFDDGDENDDRDQFCVFRKDISSNMLSEINEDNRLRIILIRSQCLPVVSSKLMVYKNFKHEINEKEIFLQHEYEDFDDVAKLIANRFLSSFCSYLESMIHAFTIDLQKTMIDNFNRLLTAKEIKHICFKTFDEIVCKPFGQKTRRHWPLKCAKFIGSKLSKEQLDGVGAWKEIQSVCRKTVEDLKTILGGLEKFLANELEVDQKKQINGWLKREVIEDNALLHEHPSIIKCIAGQRDDAYVVKVYISGDISEENKAAFKQSCKLLENMDFEFVNIEETNEMPEEIEKITVPKKEAPDIIQLKKVIQEHTDKLYASYSNIIGIRIGSRMHGDELDQPCIILYCLDKTLIPFGEKKLPDTLEGWPCDVREDFIMLGTCTPDCRSKLKTADLPQLGCSIGMPSDKRFGSVGFMYESRNSDEFGFLTASHVATKSCHLLYKHNLLLSQQDHRREEHCIVHPSWLDNDRVNHNVGSVVESIFGNYKSSVGLDFAAVRTNIRRKGEKKTVDVYNEDEGIYGTIVLKIGRTTGRRLGLLTDERASVKIVHDKKEYIFKNVYFVRNLLGQGHFFEKGDSGSGVFVAEGQEPGKALGIGFAVLKTLNGTYICKIADILNDLKLNLVRYNDQILLGTNET